MLYMASATDYGAPGSYFSLTGGTPVCTSDGLRLGEVRQVLGDFESDVFDGLVVATADGERFVEASLVDRVYERMVVLLITADQARRLPEPPPTPPVVKFGWRELGEGRPIEPSPGRLVRLWRRLRGRR